MKYKGGKIREKTQEEVYLKYLERCNEVPEHTRKRPDPDDREAVYKAMKYDLPCDCWDLDYDFDDGNGSE